MPANLDPAIVQLVPDKTKRTNFIVSIDTATPRRWTPYPTGLTVGGLFYSCVDVSVSGVVESLEDSQPAAASITIANANGAASDLAYNNANRRKPVTIHRVWFDASWTLAGTELWFAGLTGKPAIRGSFLTITCSRNSGRRGSSPTRTWAEVMTLHQVPDNASVRWVS
jgi:hypothetical protein